MTILRKFPKLLATLLIALSLAAAGTVATPALASADNDRSYELTVTKAAPDGNFNPDTVCQGPFFFDPFAFAFLCVIDVPTTFFVTCSDGFAFPPFTLPPGNWQINIDCFPATFGSFTWLP